MRVLIWLLLAAWGVAGCRRIECEEFQLDHPLMGWHWFADLQPSYTFVNGQGRSVLLVRTEYEREAAEKRWCHLCLCTADLRTDYTCEMLGLLFQCDIDYAGEAESDAVNGNVYYGVNRLYSAQRDFSSFRSRDSTLDASVGSYSSALFTVHRRPSITLLATTVSDVLELAILDTAQAGAEVVWVKKGQGLIGFQRGGEVWVRQ
ncbi:hypothetical protein LRS06_20310 [Hymenobacter sp. J193]|uniref:hypothetical protein n=1 Tax=Hymenobacter sp. J193 TaxID=2898429 RepID=UPI0021510863|nr:hypothetical protein [Hymenobacter sp. J193]MCR5890074.1 hypothetical protein [Hymenobacter sp. J193]